MFPMHRRHQQLLQEAFGRDPSNPLEDFNGSTVLDNDFSKELNSTATTMENLSLNEKVPPSLRILRWA